MTKTIGMVVLGLFLLSVVWDYSRKWGGILLVIIVGGILLTAKRKGLLST